MTDRLCNKVAIVTGASKGIGKAIAKLYAQEGAKVLAVFHSDKAAAQQTLEEIQKAGGEATLFQADVSKKADMERMAEETLRLYGRIDVLCSNAGIFPHVKLEDMTEEEWEHVILVNLTGTFLAVKACLPQLQAQNYGRIVIISSMTGPRTGVPGLSHYGASKGGVMGFINNACLELATYNITCNAVEPGVTLTEGMKQQFDEAFLKEVTQEIPLKAMVEPIDIAQAVLFLSTDESRYITGQSIVVDGGLLRPEVSLRFFERE